MVPLRRTGAGDELGFTWFPEDGFHNKYVLAYFRAPKLPIRQIARLSVTVPLIVATTLYELLR